GGAGGAGGLDPPDHRAAADDETAFATACAELSARLSAEERAVLEARLRDETLGQIAARLGRPEGTISNRLKRIRAVLEAQGPPSKELAHAGATGPPGHAPAGRRPRGAAGTVRGPLGRLEARGPAAPLGSLPAARPALPG